MCKILKCILFVYLFTNKISIHKIDMKNIKKLIYHNNKEIEREKIRYRRWKYRLKQIEYEIRTAPVVTESMLESISSDYYKKKKKNINEILKCFCY